MRFCQKLNEILVRIEIYTKPPFSMTEHQIEKKKKKKKHLHKKNKKTRAQGETFNKQYNHEVS